MQGVIRVVRSCHEKLKVTILQHPQFKNTSEMNKIFARFGRVISFPTVQNKEANDIVVAESSTMQQKGLENTTVADVLMIKDEEKGNSWICCRTNDTAHDAIKKVSLLKLLHHRSMLIIDSDIVCFEPSSHTLMMGCYS